MSFIAKKGLLNTATLCLQTKRFRGKINVQKPRKPHFEKALLLEVTKPYFLKGEEAKRRDALCDHERKLLETCESEVNHLQMIYAKELRAKFETSKLIAFYHKNPIAGEKEYNAYAAFHRLHMEYKVYGKETLKFAIEGSPYECVLDFYVSRNAIVFGKEVDLKKMLRVNRKFPELVLLAAIYENQFISKDQLLKLAEIPNIQVAQAGLVHVLQSLGSQLVHNLNAHQQTLLSHLSERTKQLQAD